MLAATVRRNVQRAANYVLGVVLFAVALFFAGMSTKLRGAGLRKALLLVGCRRVRRHRGVDRHVPDQRLGVTRASSRRVATGSSGAADTSA